MRRRHYAAAAEAGAFGDVGLLFYHNDFMPGFGQKESTANTDDAASDHRYLHGVLPERVGCDKRSSGVRTG